VRLVFILKEEVMGDILNQAVLFTKPLHHLGLSLTPAQLDERVQTFFTQKGFNILLTRPVTGESLSERNVIKQHYLMYSRAACVQSADELALTDEAKGKFESAFGKNWDTESSKVLGSPALQQAKGISTHELFLRWNEQFTQRKTCKVQDGVILARLDDLDGYCINAFYPAMEENFNNPATQMTYYVVEFDPSQISWKLFRKNILGATDAAKAESESIRGLLYTDCKVEYSGRDNFIHGSAGPLEGLVERAIHEPDFNIADNPVGRMLAERSINLDQFKQWKLNQTISQLGDIFDATEEKNTSEILNDLAAIRVS
jgi:hypothetical protein